METLDDHIAPDEPVLWRSPTLRDSVLDMARMLAWVTGLLVVSAFLSLGSEFAGGVLTIPLLILGYFTKIFLRGPTDVLLTKREVWFQRRIRRPGISSLERRDIVNLEIFASDNVLVLHGKHGELHRATLLDGEMDLARELDLPTILWKPYKPTKRAGRIDFGLTVLLPFAILGFTIAIVAALPDAYFEMIRDNWSKPAKPLAALATILGASAVSWPAAAVLIGLIRRSVLPRAELNQIRCARFTPLWQGKYPVTARADGPLRKVRRLFDRAIYGPFPNCGDPEPERYEPGAFPPPQEDEEDD